MITERDKRQLEAIIAIVKPLNSLEARLEKLTDEQRFQYEWYCWRLEQWRTRISAKCPDDYDEDDLDAHLYERSIEAWSYQPRLRADIDAALFGSIPKILKTDTEDDAARKWMEYVQ